MRSAKHQPKLRAGQCITLNGHRWRLIAVTAVDPGLTLAEEPGPYGTATRPVPATPEFDAPWCVVVAGPNGAGKTTFAMEYLPAYVACQEFVNPDLIAAGLAPLAPATAGVRAGRLVVESIHALAARRISFAFETTLSGKSHLKTLAALKRARYRICLALVWIPTPELSAARIACRVQAGGHHVPDTDVRRRWPRILANLPRYVALADRILLFDNTGCGPVRLYERTETGESVGDADAFARLRKETGL